MGPASFRGFVRPMTTSDFARLVREAFAALLDRGVVEFEASDYDPASFGNAFVVLAGVHFRLRLVRDRGEVFAQVAAVADPDHWYPLQRVVRAIGASPAPPERPSSVEELAALVTVHHAELELGLAQDRFDGTRARLDDLGREAVERLKGGGLG